MKQLMAAKRDVAAASAATMVGDGALNVTGAPILNLLILQNGQVEFYRAQNCAGKVKDAQFIADDFIAAIRAQQRPRDVVYVLTDGACKKSWPIIEEACPWVTCGWCMPHVCDLLLEDIGRLPFFEKLFAEADELRKFVRGHSHVKSAYETHCETVMGRPGETRFNKNAIGLANLLRNRKALVATMGDAAVLAAMAKVKGDKLVGAHATLGALFAHLQALVVDEDFWARVEWALKVSKPIGQLLRFCEQDCATASKVHHAWFCVQETIEQMDGIPAELKTTILEKLRYRWDCGYNDIQGAGYVMDPQFRLCEQDDETMESFRSFRLKCYPAPKPPAPDEDEDAATAAAAQATYEAACEAHTLLLATIDEQLQAYRNGDGVWSRPEVVLNCKRLSALSVWQMYGQEQKELQHLALRALGCVSGAAAAERGHKEMNFIQDKVRNRLKWGKVESLMYVRINLPLVYPKMGVNSNPNVDFVLAEDDADAEEPVPLPSEWRSAAPPPPDDDELEEAVLRSRSRAANLRRSKAGAARFAPVPNPSVDQPVNDGVDRGAGRRVVKRPREWRDFD